MSIGLPEKEKALKLIPPLEDAAILVIDDDPAFQLGLKTFLREYAGFQKVFTAASGDEALEMVTSEPSISVITLDNEMPGMTGMEMLAKLGNEPDLRPLSVVMITGQGSGELEKSFLGFKSDKLITRHFLAKPVAFEELEPIIINSYEELQSRQMTEEPNIQSLIAEDNESVDEAPEDSTMPVPPSGNINDHLRELKAQLECNTDALKELQGRIPSIEKRFWLSVLKIMTLGVLLWLALQFDGLNHAKKWVNQVKTYVLPAAESVDKTEPAEKAPAVIKSKAIPPKEKPKSESPAKVSPAKAPKQEAIKEVKEQAVKKTKPATPPAKPTAKAPAGIL